MQSELIVSPLFMMVRRVELEPRSYSRDSVFIAKTQKGYLAKTALMDAAIPLIANKGISGFSIEELCQAASMKRTSYYTYFKSIDQLVMDLWASWNRAAILGIACLSLRHKKGTWRKQP